MNSNAAAAVIAAVSAPRSPHGRGRGIRAALLALILVLAGGWAAHAGIFSRPVAYAIDIAFERFPANDLAIEHWLDRMDGVSSIKISRAAGRLNVKFEARRDMGAALLFDLAHICENYGYLGRTEFNGKLFDSRQQGSTYSTFWVEFGQLPTDDRAVTDWLKLQPGAAKIQVRRVGHVVVFEFQNSTPPVPTILGDILQQCEQLGYHRRAGFVHAFGQHHPKGSGI